MTASPWARSGGTCQKTGDPADPDPQAGSQRRSLAPCVPVRETRSGNPARGYGRLPEGAFGDSMELDGWRDSGTPGTMVIEQADGRIRGIDGRSRPAGERSRAVDPAELGGCRPDAFRTRLPPCVPPY